VIQIFSNLYPRIGFPSMGIFVHDHAQIIAELTDTKVSVLKTIFPPINSDWEMYGANPMTLDKIYEIETVPFFSIPKFKTIWESQLSIDWYLNSKLETFMPKLAILHFLYPSGLVAKTLQKNKIPFIVHAHGSDISKFLKQKTLLEHFETFLPNAEYIFIAGKSSMNEFLHHFPNLKNKTIWFPNPISVDLKKVDSKNTISNHNKKVITVANIAKEKGVDLILPIAHSNPDINFIIVGNINSSSYSQSFVKAALNYSNIQLIKAVPRNELQSLMQTCNLYLHTSRSEAFGLAVSEAILLGLPIYGRKNGILQDLPSSEQLHYFESKPDDLVLKELISLPKQSNTHAQSYLSGLYGKSIVKESYKHYLKPWL